LCRLTVIHWLANSHNPRPMIKTVILTNMSFISGPFIKVSYMLKPVNIDHPYEYKFG